MGGRWVVWGWCTERLTSRTNLLQSTTTGGFVVCSNHTIRTYVCVCTYIRPCWECLFIKLYHTRRFCHHCTTPGVYSKSGHSDLCAVVVLDIALNMSHIQKIRNDTCTMWALSTSKLAVKGDWPDNACLEWNYRVPLERRCSPMLNKPNDWC